MKYLSFIFVLSYLSLSLAEINTNPSGNQKAIGNANPIPPKSSMDNKEPKPKQKPVRKTKKITAELGANYFINTTNANSLNSRYAGFSGPEIILTSDWEIKSKKILLGYKMNPGEFDSSVKEFAGTKKYSWDFFEASYGHPLFNFHSFNLDFHFLGLVGAEYHKIPIIYLVSKPTNTILTSSGNFKTISLGFELTSELTPSFSLDSHFKYELPVSPSYTINSSSMFDGDLSLSYLLKPNLNLMAIWNGALINQNYTFESKTGTQTLFFSCIGFGIAYLY